MRETQPRPVLLYDAACRLCRFTARVIALIDTRTELMLLPLQDAEAVPLLAGVPEEDRLVTWLLVSGSSRVGYGRGLVELLRAMRLTRPAARVLGVIPARSLDRVYTIVSRNRRRIGRLVPDGSAPRRYSPDG